MIEPRQQQFTVSGDSTKNSRAQEEIERSQTRIALATICEDSTAVINYIHWALDADVTSLDVIAESRSSHRVCTAANPTKAVTTRGIGVCDQQVRGIERDSYATHGISRSFVSNDSGQIKGCWPLATLRSERTRAGQERAKDDGCQMNLLHDECLAERRPLIDLTHRG
jgi:hypothetical protein